MKTTLSILALCTLGASSLLGCSTESKSVDPADALGRFQHPSGSFSGDSGSAAFSGYQSDRAASSKVAVPDGATSASGGSATTQSLHVLTMTTSNQSQCGEGRKCSCDGSGSFTYSEESSDLGTQLRFQFDHCLSADGSGFDGQAAIVLSDKPILGIRAANASNTAGAAASSSGTTNFLLVADGTGFDGGTSAPLAFALASEAGYTFLSVDLPDGNVVVGAAADGTVYVKAKEGSWTCNPDDAAGYACVSDDGAPAVKVAKDAPAPR
jgi:hypothetical protein